MDFDDKTNSLIFQEAKLNPSKKANLWFSQFEGFDHDEGEEEAVLKLKSKLGIDDGVIRLGPFFKTKAESDDESQDEIQDEVQDESLGDDMEVSVRSNSSVNGRSSANGKSSVNGKSLKKPKFESSSEDSNSEAEFEEVPAQKVRKK